MSRGCGESVLCRERDNVDVVDQGRRHDEVLQRAASSAAAGSPPPLLLLHLSLPFLCFSSLLGGGGWEGENSPRLGFVAAAAGVLKGALGIVLHGGPGR